MASGSTLTRPSIYAMECAIVSNRHLNQLGRAWDISLRARTSRLKPSLWTAFLSISRTLRMIPWPTPLLCETSPSLNSILIRFTVLRKPKLQMIGSSREWIPIRDRCWCQEAHLPVLVDTDQQDCTRTLSLTTKAWVAPSPESWWAMCLASHSPVPTFVASMVMSPKNSALAGMLSELSTHSLETSMIPTRSSRSPTISTIFRLTVISGMLTQSGTPWGPSLRWLVITILSLVWSATRRVVPSSDLYSLTSRRTMRRTKIRRITSCLVEAWSSRSRHKPISIRPCLSSPKAHGAMSSMPRHSARKGLWRPSWRRVTTSSTFI